MSYNKPTISNYNDDAPADDGSAVTANKVKWSKIKDELGDPLKSYADAINNAVETAFLQLFLADHETKTTNFTPSASDDDGTLFVCTNALTMTLPVAADAGEGYTVSTLNISGGTVTGDGASAETINGSATYSSLADYELTIYMCTGTAWYAVTVPNMNNLRAKKIKFPDDGELTIATGAITVTGTYHTVDTEADAASDNLDTISGGVDGQILILQTENSSRDVVITESGNIVTPFAASFTLGTVNNAATLIYSGALSKWVVIAAPQASATAAQGALAATALQPSFLHIQDQKAAGTNGGASTSGSWQTKTLNTEVTDTIGSTLSSNEFTLPAGTYEIDAKSPACFSNAHQARLYNVTDAAVALYGTSEFSSSGSQVITQSHITGRITIADTKTFRIEHRVAVSRATDGYGAANNFGGTEIYTDVRVYKV